MVAVILCVACCVNVLVGRLPHGEDEKAVGWKKVGRRTGVWRASSLPAADQKSKTKAAACAVKLPGDS